MKIFIEKTNKTKEMKYGGKLSGLLLRLKMNEEDVLVIRKKEVVLPEQIVKNSDCVQILSVVSGG